MVTKLGVETQPVDTSHDVADDRLVWKSRHLLDVDNLSRREIEHVLETAREMQGVLTRPVPRTPALRGVTVCNLFYEASTRTRASFELAGKTLGADVINITASGSSVEKGESLIDTVKTIVAEGVDVLVMRHSATGAPYLAAQTLCESEVRVINAGDGQHAHPTQALLDAHVLQDEFGHLDGRRVVIVGDVLHSRVARSNIWALTRLGADVTLVAPRPLIPSWFRHPGEDAEHDLALPRVSYEPDLDVAVKGADVIMALRIHHERMRGAVLPSIAEYARRYQITPERLASAAPDAVVMHPGPMNRGVEIAFEVADCPQSRIEAQVAAGPAIRMAVLFLLVRGAS